MGLIRAKRRDEADAEPAAPGSRQSEHADVAAAVAGVGSDGTDGPPQQKKSTPLGELLLGEGLLSEDQLKEALLQQTATGERLGQLLVSLGVVDERALVRVLADQLGMEVVDLRTADLDEETVSLLPEETARRLCAIPLRLEGQRIDVAVGDPHAEFLTKQLIDVFNAPVRLLLAARSDVERAINHSYRSTARLGDALRVFEERMETRRVQLAAEPTQQAVVVDENAPVVQVVNAILEQAVRDRASDIHIEPQEDRLRVRVRTDGALHEVSSLPMSMGPSLVSRIKVMADMNIVERRRPQDGQMAVTVGGREMDVRVATTGSMFGEKCVMRLLDKSRALLRLNELGMPPDTAERYSDLIHSPYGMVICAGPTGSGKTTTLYASLTEISNDEINVTTIEDPVEYVFPSITQIQINEQAGITFAAGLRSILRQDPDAILVGEIRDVETARIAVQAALTGHFVLSSLHATDTAAAMHRFLDMGIEPFLVASSLLGVVGQRLIRRLCPHCTEPYTPSPEELAFYRKAGGDPDKTTFARGAGCNFCGQTGYFERVGIYEVMRVTNEIKELVAESSAHETLRALAVEQGMRTLQDQAVRLVTEDQTTIAEVLRTIQVV